PRTLLDLAHLGLRALELGGTGAGDRELLGGGALFREQLFGEIEPSRQFPPLVLPGEMRALEALDRTELTLEECHANALAGSRPAESVGPRSAKPSRKTARTIRPAI